MSINIKKNKKREKNITINDLARATNGLTKNVNTISTATHGLIKKVNSLVATVDDLARSVKEGFDEVHGTIKAGFDKVDNRLTALENGQEEIKLRLSNVAYRFEVVELENQVKTLTKQMKTLERLVMSKLKRQSNEA